MNNDRYTSKYRRRERLRLIKIFALSLALIIFLSFFSIYVVKNMGKRPITTTTSETTEAATSELADTSHLIGTANFLIACVSEEGVTFASVVNVNLEERLFTFSMLDTEKIYTLNGEKDSLDGYYLAGGIEKFYAAAKNGTGIDFLRYAVTTEMNFVKIVKLLGSVEVYVEENINIDRDDVSINLGKGFHKLDYNNLLNYMKYSSQGVELLYLQAETLCCIFKTYFTEKNYMQGESLFTSIINLIQTDINAYDFVASQSIINSLISGEANFVKG